MTKWMSLTLYDLISLLRILILIFVIIMITMIIILLNKLNKERKDLIDKSYLQNPDSSCTIYYEQTVLPI